MVLAMSGELVLGTPGPLTGGGDVTRPSPEPVHDPRVVSSLTPCRAGSRSPEVYYDPRSLDLDGPTGVLHAKAVIADLKILFVTSANLTEAAFDKNVEMGLLARDPALALSAVRHFQVLIERELVRRLPRG
jgi:phosphatidylserine/phosphatidylglycerophosphate/cardiolipin synthase-like enzyme